MMDDAFIHSFHRSSHEVNKHGTRERCGLYAVLPVENDKTARVGSLLSSPSVTGVVGLCSMVSSVPWIRSDPIRSDPNWRHCRDFVFVFKSNPVDGIRGGAYDSEYRRAILQSLDRGLLDY
uniref:Uncharacterized protein n=1 Tax=Pseudo-nitzschia australis TaxID=44445 RepID=A0A7S4EGQ1_9STRA